MKKCMQCGTQIPDDEVFCSECGTELALNKEVQETLIEDAVVISTEETGETAPVLEEEANLEDVLDEVEAETKPAEPIPEKPVSKKKKYKTLKKLLTAKQLILSLIKIKQL